MDRRYHEEKPDGYTKNNNRMDPVMAKKKEKARSNRGGHKNLGNNNLKIQMEKNSLYSKGPERFLKFHLNKWIPKHLSISHNC